MRLTGQAQDKDHELTQMKQLLDNTLQDAQGMAVELSFDSDFAGVEGREQEFKEQLVHDLQVVQLTHPRPIAHDHACRPYLTPELRVNFLTGSMGMQSK